MLFKRAGRLQRLQRLDDDDVAALHVDDAGAARVRLVDPLELLERAVRFEHRVEMADQQDLRSRPGMLGDEVPGALERRAVDPPRLEAERVELRRKTLPTSRTPSKFCVPLLMLTTRSSSASASLLCASTNVTSAFSSAFIPGACDIPLAAATPKTIVAPARIRFVISQHTSIIVSCGRA